MEAILNKLIKSASDNRKAIIVLIKIVTAISLIIFLLFYADIDNIIYVISNADTNLLVISALLMFLNFFLQFVRWRVVTKELLQSYSKRKAFYSLFFGVSTGIISPARLGEHVGRALPYRDKKISDVLLASVTDKVFGMAVIMAAGIVSLFYYGYIYIALNIYLISAIIVFILVTAAVYVVNNASYRNYRIVKWMKSKELIYKSVKKLKLILRLDKKLVAKLSLLSVAIYVTFVTQYILAITAMDHRLAAGEYFLGLSMVFFVKSFIPQFSVGELGVRESVTVFFMGIAGVSAAAALNTSLFIFVINLAVPSLFGLVLMAWKRDV